MSECVYEKMNDDPYLLDNRTQSSVVKGMRQEITYGKKKQQHKTRTCVQDNNLKSDRGQNRKTVFV